MLQKGPSKKTLTTSALILGTATLTAAEEASTAVVEVVTEATTAAVTAAATTVATEAATTVVTEAATEAATEITSENAAGLLSTLLEGGSSLANGAWNGFSGGASYVFNNPGEAASGALETAGEFLCDNALAVGLTVGAGLATAGFLYRKQISEKFSATFRTGPVKPGTSDKSATKIQNETSTSSQAASSTDGEIPKEERRSPSPRPGKSTGSDSD